MKLKTFNPLTTPVARGQHTKAPSIHVNIKTGLFTLNKTAAELIGVIDGNMVQIHQNEDDPQEWFIEKVKKDGFIVRANSKEGIVFSYLFNNATIARMIFQAMKTDKTSGRVIVGEEVKVDGHKLFTLVTASLTV